MHRYGVLVPLAKPGQITPQPYGTYTYIIKTVIYGGRVVMKIDRLIYSDGSYDVYIGMKNYPPDVVQAIEHHDKAGALKSVTWLNRDTGRYDHIDYIADGGLIFQRDVYTYNKEGVLTTVIRYGNLNGNLDQKIAVFFYEGTRGLEKLVRCELDRGVSITYKDSLANAVWDKSFAGPGPILKFIYDMDQYGNILSTKVISRDGKEMKYEGLADPVDIAAGYKSRIDKLVETASAYLVKIFRPDVLKFVNWAISPDGSLYALFELKDGSPVVINVNMNTAEPSMDEKLKEAVLKAREDASMRLNIPIEDAHVNGVIGWMISIDKVSGYLIKVTTPKFELSFNYNSNTKRLELKSLVDRQTQRDYVKESKNAVIELFNPESHNASVGRWVLENGVLIFEMVIDYTYPYYPHPAYAAIPVRVNIVTGEVQIEPSIADAVKKSRKDTSEKLGLPYDNVWVNGISELLSPYIDGHLNPAGYAVYVTTAQFNITYNYDIKSGSIKLASFINRQTGQDLLKNAIGYLKEIFNPETFELTGWSGNGDMAFDFKLKDIGFVTIMVNPATGVPYIPGNIRDIVIKVREETANNLNIPMGDVHVNGIIGYASCGGFAPGASGYFINVSTPQFILTYNYEGSIINKGTLRLTSLVSRQARQDLLKNAIDYLKDIFNPNGFTLIKWTVTDGVAEFGFELPDGRISVTVDVATGVPSMANNLKEVVLKTREDIATKMAIDMEGVHINGLTPLAVIDNWRTRESYEVSAQVNNYTLKLNYRSIWQWGIVHNQESGDGYWPGQKWFTITLTSFVDNNTGRDYVKEAESQVLALLNPEYNNIGVTYWHMQNGLLMLNIDLYGQDISYFHRRMGDIPVEVDPRTGEVRIDPAIVAAIMNVKNEVSSKLHIDNMNLIHINEISDWYVIEPMRLDDTIVWPSFRVVVSTPQFNLTFDCDKRGTPKLVSLVNKETGQDLLANAITHLQEIFNPSEFVLDSWGYDGDYIGFGFKLKDGSIVKVNVDINTGTPWLPRDLKEVALKTRETIAQNMGVDIQLVHLDGIRQLCPETDNYPYPYGSIYELTASVNNYTLKLNYDYLGPWLPYYQMAEDENTIVIERRGIVRITLTSFVDNNTGRDYVKEAEAEVLALLNPEYNNVGVAYWYLDNGVLKLSIDIRHKDSIFRLYGSDIPVEVNLATGQINIDQRIVDAVTKVRNEIADKLHIDNMNSIHINEIYQMWWIQYGGNDSPYYFLNVSTPQFNLTYSYALDGKARLTALVSRETGQDLLASTQKYLTEVLHINDFRLDDWRLTDDHSLITFKYALVDGSTIELGVDIRTGEIRRMVKEREYVDPFGERVKESETTLFNERGAPLKIDVTRRTYDSYGNLVESYDRSHEYSYYENGTIREVNTTETTRDVSGNVVSAEHFTVRYNPNGTLQEEDSESMVYAPNGTLLFHDHWIVSFDENGNRRHENRKFALFDGNGNILTLDYFSESYDEQGRLTEGKAEHYVYDGNGNIMMQSYSTHTLSYNPDGSLREESISNEVQDGSGAKISSFEYRANYDASGKFVDGYYIASQYDNNGRLSAMDAQIGVAQDNQVNVYNVKYELDGSGNVIFTHVYDANGQEISELSGDGFRHPSEILKSLESPGSDLLKDAAEKYSDQEILHRKAVEELVQANANDRRFVEEMARRHASSLVPSEAH